MPLWLLPILRSKWLHIGLLALACGLLFIRGNHYKAKAENCAIGRQNDHDAYANAQVQAKAAAIAEKLAVEASYRAKAKEADDDYQTALDRARSAASAYAARMRTEGSRGSPGSPVAPANNRGPGLPQTTATDAIVVSRNDFDICTENSVKIEAAWGWAKTLNQTAPDPSFGRP